MSRIEQALQKAASSRARIYSSPKAPLDTVPAIVDNPMLAAMRGNSDVVSEEYNKLRSLIGVLTQGEQFNNALLVSSSVSEEGKSLTAINLAIAIAKDYDHTVLLVDTDFRRPSLHKFLGIEPEIGLIQCLKDNIPISQALINTGIGKLVLLPAGGYVTEPVEILSSNRMKEVVNELKNRYSDRYVIFDTPPVLPFADAQVLAPAVDGVIFVVREGKAKAKDVQKAVQTLNGTNLLGVVYNDTHSFKKKKHYYYY